MFYVGKRMLSRQSKQNQTQTKTEKSKLEKKAREKDHAGCKLILLIKLSKYWRKKIFSKC